jgi:hypothetical protein
VSFLFWFGKLSRRVPGENLAKGSIGGENEAAGAAVAAALAVE